MDLSNIFSSVISVINTIEIGDIIDVGIMTFVIYQVIMLAKKSKIPPHSSCVRRIAVLQYTHDFLGGIDYELCR